MFHHASPDPYGWEDLFRGFERLFREFDGEVPVTSPGNARARVSEEDDRFVLRIEVPGLSEKDVQVEFDKGVLTVSAQRTVDVPEGYTALRRERIPVRFSRSFAFGDAADAEKTTAELKDGVLTVGVGKSDGKKKRTIAVSAS